jgi:hypothetical protein
MEAKLVADVLDVSFCGAERDREAIRDLGIRHPLRNELRDLGLPAAQHRGVPRSSLTFPSRRMRRRKWERKFPAGGPPSERGEIPLGIRALPVRESRSQLLGGGRAIAGPAAPQKQISALEPGDRERERQVALHEERLGFTEERHRDLRFAFTSRPTRACEKARGAERVRLGTARVAGHELGPALDGGDITEALRGEQREDRDRTETAPK